ncbi:hypothetical protein [Kitasatospora sp. NPDC096204]|uniref:MmyB family transcriptional regulator n=1 Tax=Kitasatospora sp. NPDC096204 TaxID=3364094 RepID=UPI00381D089E
MIDDVGWSEAGDGRRGRTASAPPCRTPCCGGGGRTGCGPARVRHLPPLDVGAGNPLGAGLIGGVGDEARRDRHQARFLFRDAASRTVHPDWADRAAEAIGRLWGAGAPGRTMPGWSH